MLSDQTDHMPAQVAGDVAKVRKAYADGLAKIQGGWFSITDTESGITGMKDSIDAWAKRGTDAAATRTGTPGAAGWPGWVQAGEVFLQGIEDIAQMGATAQLDAITAQALDVPATTVDTAKKATKAVAAKAVKAAKAAVDVGVATSSTAGSVFGAFESGAFLFQNLPLIIGGLVAYKLFFSKKGKRK